MYLSKPATVNFDPANKVHRAAARAFMKRKAWVDCPIRFTHDPQYGSVAEQVQAKLLDWYVAQEEARETKRLVAKFEKGGAAALRDMRESLIVAQARGMLPPSGDVPFKLHDFGPRGLTVQGEPVLSTIGVVDAR